MLFFTGLASADGTGATHGGRLLLVAPNVVQVEREAYPDPTAKNGDWVSVDMKAVRRLPKPVTLVEIKADPSFADMQLVRQSRLSVTPVSKSHWDKIWRMGGCKA